MKKLLFTWGVLNFFLLAAGGISIVFAVLWGQPNLLLNLFISRFDLNIGLVLGSMYILTALIGLPGITRPKDQTMLLKAFNWGLVVDAAVTLILGSAVWFFSLRQRDEFGLIWGEQDASIQQGLQDMFSCCGYWNGTQAGQFTTARGFCEDTTFAANQTGCVTSITANSDYTLNNIFSTIYGFEAILVLLFLATVCVINERGIAVRFARIDEKRGGGGFV